MRPTNNGIKSSKKNSYDDTNSTIVHIGDEGGLIPSRAIAPLPTVIAILPFSVTFALATAALPVAYTYICYKRIMRSSEESAFAEMMQIIKNLPSLNEIQLHSHHLCSKKQIESLTKALAKNCFIKHIKFSPQDKITPAIAYQILKSNKSIVEITGLYYPVTKSKRQLKQYSKIEEKLKLHLQANEQANTLTNLKVFFDELIELITFAIYVKLKNGDQEALDFFSESGQNYCAKIKALLQKEISIYADKDKVEFFIKHYNLFLTYLQKNNHHFPLSLNTLLPLPKTAPRKQSDELLPLLIISKYRQWDLFCCFLADGADPFYPIQHIETSYQYPLQSVPITKQPKILPFVKLKSLNLSNADIGNKKFNVLAKVYIDYAQYTMLELEIINLSGNRLTSAKSLLKFLAHTKILKDLSLANNKLGGNYCRPFKGNSGVEKIVLWLAKNSKNLRHIDFSQTGSDENDAITMLKQRDTTLLATDVDLSDNPTISHSSLNAIEKQNKMARELTYLLSRSIDFSSTNLLAVISSDSICPTLSSSLQLYNTLKNAATQENLTLTQNRQITRELSAAHNLKKFILSEVEPDGNCAYSAYGIGRDEAFALLLTNISLITPLIAPLAANLLLTTDFYLYLKQNDFFKPDHPLASIIFTTVATDPQKYAHHPEIIEAYLCYDIRDQLIENELGRGAWTEFRVIQAIALCQRMNLYIWQKNEQEEIIPAPDFDNHVIAKFEPEHANTSKHLLFVNNNHFDELIEAEPQIDEAETASTITDNTNEESNYLDFTQNRDLAQVMKQLNSILTRLTDLLTPQQAHYKMLQAKLSQQTEQLTQLEWYQWRAYLLKTQLARYSFPTKNQNQKIYREQLVEYFIHLQSCYHLFVFPAYNETMPSAFELFSSIFHIVFQQDLAYLTEEPADTNSDPKEQTKFGIFFEARFERYFYNCGTVADGVIEPNAIQLKQTHEKLWAAGKGLVMAAMLGLGPVGAVGKHFLEHGEETASAVKHAANHVRKAGFFTHLYHTFHVWHEAGYGIELLEAANEFVEEIPCVEAKMHQGKRTLQKITHKISPALLSKIKSCRWLSTIDWYKNGYKSLLTSKRTDSYSICFISAFVARYSDQLQLLSTSHKRILEEAIWQHLEIAFNLGFFKPDGQDNPPLKPEIFAEQALDWLAYVPMAKTPILTRVLIKGDLLNLSVDTLLRGPGLRCANGNALVEQEICFEWENTTVHPDKAYLAHLYFKKQHCYDYKNAAGLLGHRLASKAETELLIKQLKKKDNADQLTICLGKRAIVHLTCKPKNLATLQQNYQRKKWNPNGQKIKYDTMDDKIDALEKKMESRESNLEALHHERERELEVKNLNLRMQLFILQVKNIEESNRAKLLADESEIMEGAVKYKINESDPELFRAFREACFELHSNTDDVTISVALFARVGTLFSTINSVTVEQPTKPTLVQTHILAH